MPYIPPENREVLTGRPPLYGSELSYVLYKAIVDYLRIRGEDEGSVTYAVLAEALAAVEGAKNEFLRRHMWPYEDTKIDQNGDVK